MPRPKVGILAVLVLYRCALEDSATWQSLRKQVNGDISAVADVAILICFNGPADSLHQAPPDGVEFASVGGNHGLAWAYNHGLAEAQKRGAAWLLTLDQDTMLPDNFLLTMATRAQELADDSNVAAIVPQLVSEDGHVLSPVIAGKWRERSVAPRFRGVTTGDVRPFNSAAITRVSALLRIGGYDRRFWLDYLDHAVFHALYKHGFTIWIEGGLQVLHHLSLQDGRQAIGAERFSHFSAAESAFRDLHGSLVQRASFTLWLLGRAVNQKRRGDPEYFLRATLHILKQRLFVSRRKRLQQWKQAVAPMASEPQVQMRLAAAGKRQ